MAYQTGDLILDTHYNGFAADVNEVWGTTGSSDFGYGQTAPTDLSTVSDGQTITAAQWSSLLSRISTIASHQGTSITAITSPTTSDPIEAYTALSGNISTIRTNRLNAAAYGATTSNALTFTSTWQTSLTQQYTISWGSADQARYFFNSGGRIRIEVSTASNGSNSKSSNWDDLVNNNVGYFFYAAQDSGMVGGTSTPSPNNTDAGFYDLTGSLVEHFRVAADAGTYSSNYVTCSASVTSTSITVRIQYVDAYSDNTGNDSTYTPSDPTLDDVQTDITTTFHAEPADTTYIADTWGVASFSGSTNSGS